MVEPQPDSNYSVRVAERAGGYDLRIRELFLRVRGPNLQQAYEELIRRKQEIIDWAQARDALDELPRPGPPAPLGAVSPITLSYVTELCRDLAAPQERSF
jgi:hypothetical protein